MRRRRKIPKKKTKDVIICSFPGVADQRAALRPDVEFGRGGKLCRGESSGLILKQQSGHIITYADVAMDQGKTQNDANEKPKNQSGSFSTAILG